MSIFEIGVEEEVEKLTVVPDVLILCGARRARVVEQLTIIYFLAAVLVRSELGGFLRAVQRADPVLFFHTVGVTTVSEFTCDSLPPISPRTNQNKTNKSLPFPRANYSCNGIFVYKLLLLLPLSLQ